jgi:RNA polymerase sigma-70 factor (ECF subfamily)
MAVLDRELVERAQRGDAAAFGLLAARSGNRLHAVAHHILRDGALAEDATQQALIDIWRKLPQLRDPDRFQGWAYRIVVRAAHAEAGRGRQWRLAVRDLDLDRRSSPDHGTAIDDRDELERAFGALTLDHRTALVLKHFAGLSNPEIAEALDVPEGTVRSRLHHAMTSLRAALEAHHRLPLESRR